MLKLRERSGPVHAGSSTTWCTPTTGSRRGPRCGSPSLSWPHSSNPTKRRDLAEVAIAKLRQEIPNSVLLEPGASPDKMDEFYRAADCLLVTSDTEGSPNVVKEALCAALPVVSVDVGDVWS